LFVAFAMNKPFSELPYVISIMIPANWSGNVVFHHDTIAACSPDQVLTIYAWDLS
jgi:hypothetical protein